MVGEKLWSYVGGLPPKDKTQLEERLRRVAGPSNVEQAYEKILNRSPEPMKTKRVLHILLAVKRPLSVEEASILLSLTGDQKHSRDLEDYVEPPERFRDSIRDLCGLFVTIQDNRVYFLHQTAREFLSQRIEPKDQLRNMEPSKPHQLNWSSSLNYAESHGILAERCLWYLSIADASSYHETFFEYCNHYWVLHFREGETAMVQQQVALATHVIHHWSSRYHMLPYYILDDHHLMETISKSVKRSIPTIFFPSWFGLSSILQALLECDPTIRDREDDCRSRYHKSRCPAGLCLSLISSDRPSSPAATWTNAPVAFADVGGQAECKGWSPQWQHRVKLSVPTLTCSGCIDVDTAIKRLSSSS